MNEATRELDELAALGQLETAWRPEETAANTALQAEVTAFLASYPFLQRDDGYVTYLCRYGGALLIRDEDGLDCC